MYRVWSAVLRLLSLAIRIVVTFIGLFELLGGILSFWGSADVRYFGNIIFGVILLWPFRKIRNLAILHWYYWLLLLNTALFIISMVIGIGVVPGVVIAWRSYFLNGLSLILNTVIVWKYGEYRAGTSRWSPFFSAMTIIRFVLVAVTLVLVILLYVLVGKHETVAGTRWLWSDGVGVVLSSPLDRYSSVAAEPLFTADAFHGLPFTLVSTGINTIASTSAVSIQMTIPLQTSGSAVIVAAPGTSVTITYNPTHGLEHMALQSRGESQTVADGSMRSLWLNTNDAFVHLSRYKDQWIASPMGPYDVWFQFRYTKVGDVFPHTTYAPGDVLRVDISKTFVKPTPRAWLGYTLPLYRSSLPWKLMVGMDGHEPKTVVDGIALWYR